MKANVLFWTVSLGLAVVGIGMILLGTRWGIGTSPDSATYLGVARSLEAGKGLRVPFGAETDAVLSQFPPMYPVLIRFISAMGFDVLVSARLIQAILFGANIILLMIILNDCTHGMHLGTVLGGMLILFAPAVAEIHLMAWSEPLFIFSGFMGLFLLSKYLSSGSNRLLVVAALWTCLACLTRYIGIAFSVTGLLAIFLLGSRDDQKRGRDATIFTLISFIPPGLWMLLIFFSGREFVGRELIFHPFGRQHFWQGVETISGWIYLPHHLRGIHKVSVIVFLGVIVLTLLLGIRQSWFSTGSNDRYVKRAALPKIIWMMLIFIPVYITLILLSLSLFDANIPLDNRILSPVLVAGLLLISFAISKSRYDSKFLTIFRNLTVLFAMIILAFSIVKQYEIIQTSYEDGIGFNHVRWRRSQVIREVQALPDGWIIYSNSPEAIYLRTGKTALRLPKVFQPVTGRENTDFLSEIMALQGRLEQEKGVIVYFYDVRGPSIPSEEILFKYLPLTTLQAANDGTIFSMDGEG